MYQIERKIQVSGFKKILVPYGSDYGKVHPFNWDIIIYAKSRELNSNDMVEDFEHIERQVKSLLDGKYINDIEQLDFSSPTEENMAKWICDTIPQCYKVRIEDLDNNSITEYIEEDF